MTTMPGVISRLGALAAASCAVLLAGGCADSLPSLPKIGDLNPFKEKQTPLPGRRVSILETEDTVTGALAETGGPIAIPPPRANAAWAQPGGEANNAPGNVELAASVRELWSADAGTGSSKAGRVTASPIVYGNGVYTLDAAGNVSAFSTQGSPVWRVSLMPETEQEGGFFSFGGSAGGGYGGGLAADDGRLYATSGYGNVAALDPASGKKLWEKNLGAPIRSSPTAAGGRVYAVSLEGRFYCLSGADGAELWSVRGLPQQASLVLNVSPAVDGDVVVAPYPSGDLIALKTADGSALWTESLSRTRATNQLASLSNAARPVIDGGMAFAIGHAGRMIATHARTGERLWSLNVPGTQTPAVAGGAVFVADTSGQLLAISRKDGKIQWTAKLPGAGPWSGPTLAGSALWLASGKGALVSVDAATGKTLTQQDLGYPVYVAPIVAQGRMYILTDSAKLLALGG